MNSYFPIQSELHTLSSIRMCYIQRLFLMPNEVLEYFKDTTTQLWWNSASFKYRNRILNHFSLLQTFSRKNSLSFLFVTQFLDLWLRTSKPHWKSLLHCSWTTGPDGGHAGVRLWPIWEHLCLSGQRQNCFTVNLGSFRPEISMAREEDQIKSPFVPFLLFTP